MSKTYKPIKGAISFPDWDASIESPQRGRLIGYASGTYAEIPAQKAALEAAGCEVVYIDHDNGFRGGMEMMFERWPVRAFSPCLISSRGSRTTK